MITRKEEDKRAKVLRRLLFTLILALTFEGLLRKLFLPLSDILFFLKDILVFMMAIVLLGCRLPTGARWLLVAYWVTIALFLPLIVLTWLDGPLLAIFGAKQYLLFPIVALAAAVAFRDVPEGELLGFFRVAALLIIPTTLLALLQLRLGAGNWLNMSVGGTSMEGFAAGGELRVSSTFPFVAQYGMFLNAQMYILAFPLLVGARTRGKFLNFLYLSLLPLLVIGTFITGSRSAVLGNLCIFVAATTLAVLKGKVKGLLFLSTITAVGFLALLAVKSRLPNAFAAYDARSAGNISETHSQEMSGRIWSMMTGWTKGLPSAPASAFGYGLGVMSNGSERVSRYAADWRAGGRWTETDLATTLFEGGYYLIFVWMGFRFFVLAGLIIFYMSKTPATLFLPATFCLGHAIVEGTIGTLAIQPPLSCWFWLATGTLVALLSRAEQESMDGTHLNGTAEVAVAPPPVGRLGRSPYAERLHAQIDE